MKFNYTLVINKPRAVVIEHFLSPTTLKACQDGFIKKELVSGTAHQTGAVSKMYYNINNKEMELTETITANKLPDTFEAFYHHKHTDNTLKCTFTELNKNQTKYSIEGEYTAVRGLIVKLIFFLFPGMFKKPAKKWTDNFKNYVENSTTVN
jgi:hypothetical protein